MEDLPLWLRLAIILLLVAGNAFFVGSEIAISSARRSRIRQLAEEGNSRAKTVKLLHEEPERFYSVTPVSYTHLDVYKRQALGDGGMTEEDALDLARSDAITAGLDEVDRRPPDDPVGAVGSDRRDVAGAEPPVRSERRGRRLRQPEVAVEQRWATDL